MSYCTNTRLNASAQLNRNSASEEELYHNSLSPTEADTPLDLTERLVSFTPAEAGVVLCSRTTNLKCQQRILEPVWVCCCICGKWRKLTDKLDPSEFIDKTWLCSMNPDLSYNRCHIPEQSEQENPDAVIVYGDFTAGSLVWAKFDNYPWWPAMIDDDPDTGAYYKFDGTSQTPSEYHVVFFDKTRPTRAWIPTPQLTIFDNQNETYKNSNGWESYKGRLLVAVEQAKHAEAMDIVQRLEHYNFVKRYFA